MSSGNRPITRSVTKKLKEIAEEAAIRAMAGDKEEKEGEGAREREEALVAQINLLQAQLESKQVENENLSIEIAQIHSKRNEILEGQAMLAELKSEVENLTGQKNELTQMILDDRDKVERSKIQVDLLNREISEKEEELKRNMKLINDAQSGSGRNERGGNALAANLLWGEGEQSHSGRHGGGGDGGDREGRGGDREGGGPGGQETSDLLGLNDSTCSGTDGGMLQAFQHLLNHYERVNNRQATASRVGTGRLPDLSGDPPSFTNSHLPDDFIHINIFLRRCEMAMPSTIWTDSQRVTGALRCLKGEVLNAVRDIPEEKRNTWYRFKSTLKERYKVSETKLKLIKDGYSPVKRTNEDPLTFLHRVKAKLANFDPENTWSDELRLAEYKTVLMKCTPPQLMVNLFNLESDDDVNIARIGDFWEMSLRKDINTTSLGLPNADPCTYPSPHISHGNTVYNTPPPNVAAFRSYRGRGGTTSGRRGGYSASYGRGRLGYQQQQQQQSGQVPGYNPGSGSGGRQNSGGRGYSHPRGGGQTRQMTTMQRGTLAQAGGSGDMLRCYNCYQSGHLSRFCPKGLRCYQCQGFGHIAARCQQ